MICDGRVVIVTGAGRGLGRAHALELARQGANVVVNDLGAELDGRGRSTGPAQEVVEEIRSFGGRAVLDGGDVSDWESAGSLVALALETFGRLDAVVNNAGVVRDRMFVNATEEEWATVVRVHVKGHFCLSRQACAHWRDESKAGRVVDARIINTTSAAGLWGSVGQAAYSAAKGAITSLTLVQAVELARYGVTANAIAPAARTRMTAEVFTEMMRAPDGDQFDAMAPENVSSLVAWLASAESRTVTGQVFEIEGGQLSLAAGWRHGAVADNGARWEPDEVGAVVTDLLAGAPEAVPVYGSGG
ncbi:MAG: SDR family oxidoreductase [Acidimicrobiales bacterium]